MEKGERRLVREVRQQRGRGSHCGFTIAMEETLRGRSRSQAVSPLPLIPKNNWTKKNIHYIVNGETKVTKVRMKVLLNLNEFKGEL